MAAPTVLDRDVGASAASDSSTYTPDLSGLTITTGKTLVIEVVADGNPDLTTTSTDWLRIGPTLTDAANAVSKATFVKKHATGSDALVVNSSSSQQFTHASFCIDVGAGLFPAFWIAGATGSSTNSNPPNCDTLLARDILFIATRGGDAQVVATVAPASFSNLQSQAAAGANGASVSTAERSMTATAALDPGTFTSANEQWVCTTLAIWADVAPTAAWEAARDHPTDNAKLMTIGQSTVAGYLGPGISTNCRATSWPVLLAGLFTAAPGRTTSFIGDGGWFTGGLFPTDYDARLTIAAGANWGQSASYASSTVTGNVTAGGAALLQTSASGTHTLRLTPEDSYDRIQTFAIGFTGSPNSAIRRQGGSTIRTLAQSSVNGTINPTDTATLASTAMEFVSGGVSSFFVGFRLWDSSVKEIEVLQAGWASSRVDEWLLTNPGAGGVGHPMQAIEAIDPDAVVVELITNEIMQGVPLATFRVNMGTLLLQLKARGFSVGVGTYMYVNPALGFSEALQDTYMDAAMDIAALLNCVGVDYRTKPGMGSYAAQVSASLIYTGDGIHPTVTGNGAIAAIWREALDVAPAAVVADAAHVQTATSPTLGAISAVSPNGGAHAHTASEPSLSASAGATSITPADAAHGHVASEPSLAAASAVAPNDTAHAQAAGSPDLAAASAVSPDDGVHAQEATAPTVLAASTVSPASAGHDHAAASPSLTAASSVALASTAHAQLATSPSLAALFTVTPADATHGQAADQPALAAGSTVAPAGATHDHAAAQPTLGAQATVAPADAAHGHGASPPTINAGGSLAVDGAQHGQTADSPTLAATAAVAPASAGHDHITSAPALAAQVTVSPADAAHGHGASLPTIGAGGSLAVDFAQHGQTADSPTLAATATVAPASAGHGHAAASPSLEFAAAISPNLAAHGHAAASPILSIGGIVAPDSATHAQTVTSPQLWPQAALALVPPSRSIAALFEDRTIAYAAEDRTICAPFRGRTIEGRD